MGSVRAACTKNTRTRPRHVLPKDFFVDAFTHPLLFIMGRGGRPTFTLMPFGGYRLSGSVALDDPNYSKIDLADNPIYGLAAGMEVHEGLVEIMWTHQDSHATAVPVSPDFPSERFGLNTDQFHFNGLYFPPGYDSVQPYAMAGLGMTRYEPSGDSEALNRFSWALGGGFKVPLTHSVELRFEGKWDPALMSSTSSTFCNTATGQCLVTTSGKLVDQFDFTAGVSLRL